MKLSQVKSNLSKVQQLLFMLPTGDLVPSHFHVTEVGKVTKNFIDCGGTLRDEEKISFQLWNENDYDHRLHPEKLMSIIELSEKVLELPDLEVEVEYQGETIGRYGLDFDGSHFLLTTQQTDCLARDKCAVPAQKPKVKLSMLQTAGDSCTPGSGCC